METKIKEHKINQKQASWADPIERNRKLGCVRGP